MPKQAVLVVDDDRGVLRVIQRSFADEAFQTFIAHDGEEALALVRDREFAVVVADLRMPKLDGLEFLREVQLARPKCKVVLMTGFTSVEVARKALEQGASEFIAKPFKPDELVPMVRRLCEEKRPVARPPSVPAPSLVGRSSAFQAMISASRRAASSSLPALLVGESGVGKSLLAEFIHVLSDRRHKNFVVVNCAAIPASLIESEMLGHSRGAFSGALDDKPGFFEIADGGTLFLDEIGELPLELQPKLLHAVETGVFHRLGEPGILRKVDIRIISATNRPIEQEVDDGRFRKDLYYRLSVMPVELPPLRERVDDIPVLVDAFLEGHASDGSLRLSGEAIAKLLAYDWPGNIRELHNALEHAISGLEGLVVEAEAIPTWVRERTQPDAAPPDEPDLGDDLNLRNMEIRHILRALRESGFNQTRAAERLGISRRTLHYRIRKHALQSRLPELGLTEEEEEPSQAELDF